MHLKLSLLSCVRDTLGYVANMREDGDLWGYENGASIKEVRFFSQLAFATAKYTMVTNSDICLGMCRLYVG